MMQAIGRLSVGVAGDAPAQAKENKKPQTAGAERVTKGAKTEEAKPWVREARERLTQRNQTKPEFQYELLLIFVRNELGAIVTIPLLAVIITLASTFWAPPFEALTWLLLLLVARAIQYSYCSQFARIPESEVDLEAWMSTLVLAELLYGVSWAGVALVGLESHDPSAHIFVFAALIVVLTVRLLFASTVMPIIYAGTVPMTLAVVTRFLLLDDPFYWAMASMAIGLHVYFIFLAKGLNATVMAMLEFRAEKGLLIAELEEAKGISDEARRRAEAANIMKSRFLATMSHELRTPLNAILGFSEVMKSEILGPIENETYKEYCESIHDSGQHLLHLINEVLDLSRIEAGKHELKEEAIHLDNIAHDCVRLMKLRAESKGIRVVEELEAGLPMVWADERALRQICLNLLSNALKFTPQGGTVTITVKGNEAGEQSLSIKDNGPGIPANEIPRVMQAFGQGSLAHELAEGGTGLGLPIAKSLTELHGGRFELKSELRRGTEVTITLPASRAVEPLHAIGHKGGRNAGPDSDRRSGDGSAERGQRGGGSAEKGAARARAANG